MNEKSEDTGLATNPDGYTFLPGEMVPEFEDAVSSLKVGEIDPKIVESSYGYHLIMRIEPDMDAIDDEDLKEKYESETYQKVLDDWSKDAKVETTKALDDLDMTKVYDKLTQLQSVIQPSPKQKPQRHRPPAPEALFLNKMPVSPAIFIAKS